MRFSKLALGLLAMGLSSVCIGPAAQAQELVVNGGFETGALGPWIATGNNAITTDPNYVHSGSYGLYYGTRGSDAPLSQTLTTVVGDTEVISFWQHQLYGTPNEVTLDFGGVRLLTLTNLAIGDWTQYTVTTTATSTSSVLTFGLRQDTGYSAIDDVSVMQSVRTSATPEPGSIALLVGLGISGAGFLARRRRSANRVA